MKLLLNEAIVPREKIQKLFIFIDHILELPENETEQFVKEISPLIEKKDFSMALTMDDTSFARYYKKIGREEGRVEGKKETALKLLEMGISMDFIEKATGLEKEEIEKLNKG